MSIHSSNSVTDSARHNDNRVKSDASSDRKDARAEAKQAQNAAILRAHEKVSLNSNNDSLKLLYKTALEGINAELEPVMGKNATQKIYESDIDTSPQATADRIVSFATKFYSRYKEMNPGETEEETLNNFLNVIKGGIDKGFEDAKNILQGLQVLEGKVKDDIEKTYSLIEEGLDGFREQVLEAVKKSEESGSDPGAQ